MGIESITLKEAEAKLCAHESETRQLAFLAGLAIGTLISARSIRALQPVIESSAFLALGPVQPF